MPRCIAICRSSRSRPPALHFPKLPERAEGLRIPRSTIVAVAGSACLGVALLVFAAGVSTKPAGGAFKCWLPIETGCSTASVVGPTLDLWWNRAAGRVERRLGEREMPTSAEGNRRLRRVLTAHYDRRRREGWTDPVIMVSASVRVPWQSVIDAIDLGVECGAKRVEFGFGTELRE